MTKEKLQALKRDIGAGFNVFLLALPLCLGIAIASNFPPMAGILSAIIGGMIASFCGSAELSIKGPAAGLIAITLSAVYQLGGGDLTLGYERTLAVGVVAALLQLLIAGTKKGDIVEMIPPSIIHGMLAAVGFIIMAKQIYVMLGVSTPALDPLSLFVKLPLYLSNLNPLAFGIGLFSLSVIFLWPLFKKGAFISPSVIILLTLIPVSYYLNLNREYTYVFMDHVYSMGPKYCLNLPSNCATALHFPDFSFLLNGISLKYILLFTFVGSLESLLTVCALDTLTSQRPPTDLNKDLRAIGIGNLISALIGGLPMISEIVRSKANVTFNAASQKSNFFHGFFMLLAVLLLPGVLNLIPLSALAALLIAVGGQLASPRQFIHVYKIGHDQFLLFLTTFFVTLVTDLLLGVSAGILLKIFIHWLRSNSLKSLFNPSITLHPGHHGMHLQVEGPLTFLGYLKFKKMLHLALQENKNLVIDLKKATYLDHTLLNKLQTLAHQEKEVHITIEENPKLAPLYGHLLSTRMKKRLK